MAVYGDMLGYFSELSRPVKVLKGTLDNKGILSKLTALKTISGILQEVAKSKPTDTADVFESVEVPTLWTRAKLTVGDFVKIDDDLFRITEQNKWKYEGNFYKYELEQWQSPNPNSKKTDFAPINNPSIWG